MITDLANNPISPSSASYTGYTPAVTELFPHDIYSFLIRSIREVDKNYGNELILRWLASEQSEFEDTYDRIKSLRNLYNPESSPEGALEYVKWLVGFTAKLDSITGDISEDDMRKLISIAVKMWKYKGTDKGLIETLQDITTNTVRLLDWFLFRIIVDEVEINRAEIDVDPWLIDEPGMSPSVIPNSVIISNNCDMTVLPSAADPIWSYGAEGAAEPSIYTVAAGLLNHDQNNGDALGGRYILTDSTINASNVSIGAFWKITDDTLVTGKPWHISIKDGVREYYLFWSMTGVALGDNTGSEFFTISKSFNVDQQYSFRLTKTSNIINVYIDGVDSFGDIDATLFTSNISKQYGFGYINQGFSQNWQVEWDDVGPTPIMNFDISVLLGETEAVSHKIRVKHVPSGVVDIVDSYWDGSDNRCVVTDAFSQDLPISTQTINDFKVGVDPDEYVSDIRLVDDGTGLLNHNLVEGIVSILRPSNERYNIRYLDHQDDFKRTYDWITVSGTVDHNKTTGRATLEDASAITSIKTDMAIDSTWSEIYAMSQFSLRDTTTGKWGEMRFYYTDENNFYAVRIDPFAHLFKLDKVTAGVRTTLDSNPLLVFYPDVFYHVSVQTEDTGSGHLIKYFLDGNYIGEVIDTDHTAGKLSVASAIGQELILTLTELYVNPLESVRIGPA